MWFFHNSIRFKVNKVWLGVVVRQPLIVYEGMVTFHESIHLHIITDNKQKRAAYTNLQTTPLLLSTNF